jgi:hypothetical protein
MTCSNSEELKETVRDNRDNQLPTPVSDLGSPEYETAAESYNK